jgi:hypothetical protein
MTSGFRSNRVSPVAASMIETLTRGPSGPAVSSGVIAAVTPADEGVVPVSSAAASTGVGVGSGVGAAVGLAVGSAASQPATGPGRTTRTPAAATTTSTRAARTDKTTVRRELPVPGFAAAAAPAAGPARDGAGPPG